jgi:hypothetical protein
MTVMSYCGHMDFGIVADRDQMRDVHRLLAWLPGSSRRSTPGRPLRDARCRTGRAG